MRDIMEDIMENNKNLQKTAMTQEERLKLAAKLDKELDEFIESLPRRQENTKEKYDWEDQLEKHPFFMKEIPKNDDDLHPLYEGLQKLKYDPDENEPTELAIAYKDDGNFNFQHKNYRLAIVAYTEGIKIKCGVSDIEATLYNNRSAAHYFLKNYRSSLRDCELALKQNQYYDKVIYRAAHCCYYLKQYEKSIEYCDRFLSKDKNNIDIRNLRKKCVNEYKLLERERRKLMLFDNKQEKIQQRIINAINNRGINVDGGPNFNLTSLEPQFPELAENSVHLDTTFCLVWPVVFLYPEYKIMDYVQKFHENHSFQQHLDVIFENYPEWDSNKEYKPDNLSIYYETNSRQLVNVEPKMTLLDVLKFKTFIVKGGTPYFIVFVKHSCVEKQFVLGY